MGSTAHVYLLELGPELSHEEVQHLSYDDPSQQLLVVKGGHVFAYDVSGGRPAGHSSLKWMYPLQEGPPVIALRPSLDNRMLALQRGPALLELVDLASGMCFVHSTHLGRGSILTFFFTDAPDTDFVVVTTRAVELNQFAERRQGLRCRERVRLQAAWARYTHETRMVVVGAAAAPRSALAAWQFASHGIVHIPLFELQGLLPASAAMRQFLPSTPAAAAAAASQHPAAAAAAPSGGSILAAAAAAAAGADGGAAVGGRGVQQQQQAQQGLGQPHKQLNPDQIWLLKMYGRVYLAHIDSSSSSSSRLELYRFYTDTIILEHVLELFSTQVQLSVVDNVLVVHHPPTAVAVLFDVALHQHTPLANPLPLRRLQLLPPDLAAAAAEELEQQQQQQQGAAAGSTAAWGSDSSSSSSSTVAAAAGEGEEQQLRGAISSSSSSSIARTRAGFRRTLIRVPGSSGSNAAAAAAGGSPAAAAAAIVWESSEVLEEGGWVFYPPAVVLDRTDKTVGRLQLDLQAVVDSAEDWPSLVGFLLRRRALGPSAPLAAEPRTLLMQVIRSALQERLGLSVLRDIFNQLLTAYADALSRAAYSAPARAAAAAAGHANSSSSSSTTAAAAAAAVGSAVGCVLDVPGVNVITPNELAKDLFQWVHDEEVVDALYLQAAVSEYCAASEALGLPPPPYLQLLTLDLLLQQEQHYQAVQLLYSQPGSSATTSLARHLLEKAGKDAAWQDQGQGVDSGAAAGQSLGVPSEVVGSSSAVAAAAAASNPTAAMALELALDVMTRQCVPELRLVGGAPSTAAAAAAGAGGFAAAAAGVVGAGARGHPRQQQGAAAGNAAGGTAAAAGGGGGVGMHAASIGQPVSKACTAALVRQLLDIGEVLQAARIARAAGGVLALGIPAVLFLQVAAGRGDLGAFAAVYRVMRPHLVDRWPDFEAAQRELCP